MQSVSLKRHDSDAQFAAAVRAYEAAMRQIQRQNYEKAKEILDKLDRSAPVWVADRARVHLRLCEQKLHPPAKPLKNAEDLYVAGVSELNARRVAQSLEYLTKAERLDPNREEIHYALAAAYALQGNTGAALEHLHESIRLRPGNRFQARLDEDFEALAADVRFQNLVNPEQCVPANAGS